MPETDFTHYQDTLESFLQDYTQWLQVRSRPQLSVPLTTELQRKTTLIHRIISEVVDTPTTIHITKDNSFTFHQTLAFTLSDRLHQVPWHDAVQHVLRIINEAIGNIRYHTLPSSVIEPVIPIHDETLTRRCLDLLQAPGTFDRVINQATQVLEARLRDSLPYERLCELIPEPKEHVGESLANHLLSSKNPVIIVSDKPLERVAFHKIVVGIMAYLRNSSHHLLDDQTEWSLAWSVVGIIDTLLAQLDNAYVPTDTNTDTPKTEHE